MQPLPARWATDLAVLHLFGSTIEEQPDHLVVRTPTNPDFHWGNFILVTDAARTGQAEHWLQVFADAHPAADWAAIGLISPPSDASAWTSQGLDVEVDEALSTDECPTGTPLAAGYQARRLADSDWERLVDVELRDNQVSGDYDPATHERFVRVHTRTLMEASQRDALAYFGVFQGEELVASLGIVVCGRQARYQSVATNAAHRRRGLAGHLLGVAAQWAAAQGCDQWVIVTEATNPAGRLYRSVGFERDVDTASVYRTPSH